MTGRGAPGVRPADLGPGAGQGGREPRGVLGVANRRTCRRVDVGGDFAQGAATLRQVLARPVPRWDVHTTPLFGLYLCSSATAPGPGVHGMCGWWAARTALRRTFGITAEPSLAPA